MKNRFFLILSFLLLASVFPLAAQNGFTVSGIVMTEQGEELPGVTIQYKNNPSKGVSRMLMVISAWTMFPPIQYWCLPT